MCCFCYVWRNIALFVGYVVQQAMLAEAGAEAAVAEGVPRGATIGGGGGGGGGGGCCGSQVGHAYGRME